MLAVLHGLVLAIGLIIPLGVQNVFVFNQGMYHKKWKEGLPVALTASICDNILILTAVLGVSILVLKIYWVKYLLVSTGILFLSYMAFNAWKHSGTVIGDPEGRQDWPMGKQILFTTAVSLLNPHAIVDTIGVIGTSSLTYTHLNARVAFTVTTMSVSWLWFFFLLTAGHYLGKSSNLLLIHKVVNRVSAIVMLFSAVVLLKVLF